MIHDWYHRLFPSQPEIDLDAELLVLLASDRPHEYAESQAWPPPSGMLYRYDRVTLMGLRLDEGKRIFSPDDRWNRMLYTEGMKASRNRNGAVQEGEVVLEREARHAA